MNILTSILIILVTSAQTRRAPETFQSQNHKRNLEDDCLTLKFEESYVAEFQEEDFIIEPIILDNCDSCYYFKEGEFFTNQYGLAYDEIENEIYVEDWSALQNNTWQTIKFSLTVAVVKDKKVSYQTHEGHFNLIIGEVDFVYTPYTSQIVEYDQDLIIDYTDIYDPYQPYSAVFEIRWVCPSSFPDCDDFGTVTSIMASDRITKHFMYFGQEYEFSATVVNINSERDVTYTDVFTLTLLYPEDTDEPNDCVEFSIVPEDEKLPYFADNEVTTVLFDNNNYTDINILLPQTSLDQCNEDVSSSNEVSIQFAVLDTQTLFEEDTYFIFDSENSLHIDQDRLQVANNEEEDVTHNQTSIKFYSFIVDEESREIKGFTTHELILRENPPTLFSNTQATSIRVDKDKVLHLDGSDSIDKRAPYEYNYEFNWYLNDYDYKWINHYRILSLKPEQRDELDINQPGKHYIYSLQLQDPTRLSDISYVDIQITPESHPEECASIKLKQDQNPIMAYASKPLQIEVETSLKCDDAEIRVIEWTSQTIDWTFWQVSNNQKIIIVDQEDIKRLPMQQDIEMSVTLYYFHDEVEYIHRVNFIIKVSREDLVGVVDYLPVVNKEEDDIILDASDSYDPEDNNSRNVRCQWTCPDAFAEICTNLDGCNQSILNDDFINMSNFNDTILNNMHRFILTLSKDNRVNIEYYYITVVDNEDHPDCEIKQLAPIDINSYSYFEADCLNVFENSTYKWEIKNWQSLNNLEPIKSLTLDQQKLRVSPFTTSDEEEILIKVTVTNNLNDKTYETPIGKYFKINDQQHFNRGNLQLSQQSVSSFLTEFQLAPIDWNSEISYTLFYQLRIQEEKDQYRVLLSPTKASLEEPIKIILPPTSEENRIYIDIFDAHGNFITESRQMNSKVDLQITPPYFALRINNLVFNPQETFDETDFEHTIYNLQANFQAYANGLIDLQDYESSYFKTLSEITIDYLINNFKIDQRLDDIVQEERKRLVRQHVIDLLYYITLKHRNLDYNIEIIKLLDLITYDENYYIGSTFIKTSGRAISVIFQTMDNVQDDLPDQLLKKINGYFKDFQIEGEELEIPQESDTAIGYKMQRVKKPEDVEVIEDVDIDEDILRDALIENGFVMMGRNDTFVSISIMDEEMNQVIKTDLERDVFITFKINQDVIDQIKHNNATYFCQSREFFNEDWEGNTTNLVEIDFEKGIVVCSFNHLSQYTLFLDIEYDDDNKPSKYDPLNPPKDQDPFQPPHQHEKPVIAERDKQLENNPIISESNSLLFMYGCIAVVGFFVTSTFLFYVIYRNDKDEDNNSSKAQIDPSFSLWKKRFKLFRFIMKTFNPYSNLFSVNNKFISKWMRNAIIQLYYLAISAFFLIIFLTSQHETYMQQTYLYAVYCVCLVLLVLLLRPLSISLVYNLFYDPNVNKISDLDSFIDSAKDAKEANYEISYHENENVQLPKDNSHQEERQRLSIGAVNGKNQKERVNTNNSKKQKNSDQVTRKSITKETARNSRNYAKVDDQPRSHDKTVNVGEDTLIIDDIEGQADMTDEKNEQYNNQSPFKSNSKMNDQAQYEVKELKYKEDAKTIDYDQDIEGIQQRQRIQAQSQRSVVDQMIQEADQQTDIDDKENEAIDPTKVFINRVIGILLIISIWNLLIIGHFFALRKIRKQEFLLWSTFSTGMFILMQILVDPLIYLWLSIVMISSKSQNSIEYFISKPKDKVCSWIFVKMLIGVEKMKDLSKRIQ